MSIIFYLVVHFTEALELNILRNIIVHDLQLIFFINLLTVKSKHKTLQLAKCIYLTLQRR